MCGTSEMNKMYLLSILFIISIVVVASQSIVKSPTNTTGTIGGTAKFVCEVDYRQHIPTMTWRYNNMIIYFYMDDQVDYPLGTNKYVVSNSHTNFTLEVRNLNYTDGGNYICEVIGQKKSAVLIVLGSPVITPVTTNEVEGKTASFTCEARFGGPSLDTISSDQHPQMKLGLDEMIFQPKPLSHLQVQFLIQKVYEIPVDDSMDTKDLKCAFGTAKSEHLISTTTLNVQYSVRNITYSPQEHKYVSGSKITCSARGNPIPLFEWRNKQKPEMVIKGQLLHITDDMEGKNSWTCTARNSVGGQMYEDEITATFEAASNIDGKNLQDKASPCWLVICPIAVVCFAAGGLGVKACQSETPRRIRKRFARRLSRRGVAETEHNGDQKLNGNAVQEPML